MTAVTEPALFDAAPYVDPAETVLAGVEREMWLWRRRERSDARRAAEARSRQPEVLAALAAERAADRAEGERYRSMRGGPR